MKVYGVSLNSGNYQGRDYKNYQLYVSRDNVRSNEQLLGGVMFDTIKLTSSFVSAKNIDCKALVGHEIEVYYNKYGQVDYLNILK